MPARRRILATSLSYFAAISFCLATPASAQPPIDPVQRELQELRRAFEELRAELTQSRIETQSLRQELQALRESLQPAEDQHLLAAKVDEQSQSKVASGSTYEVHLSGIALFSAFHTRRGVDNIDLPLTARPLAAGESSGSSAATVRQSLVSLEVFGPTWAGARASGEVKFDFFGGLPGTPEGATTGLVRLRTARLNLEWKNNTIVAGQDAPFFSPLSPTSLVSTAYPALSSAGNLWTWTPQIYIEHRIDLSDRSKLILQGGILDALTGELPNEYNRTPTAGERTHMPAYAGRLAWQRSAATWGAGVYYSRQDWTFHRLVGSWLVTSGGELPLGRQFSLSGEIYRGLAIGGFGGGATPSVLFIDNYATTAYLPVRSTGGWAQLKFKPLESLQFNAAFGKDASSAPGIEWFAGATGLVHRNASAFVNLLYAPRTNLLFSLEYRRLWTSRFGVPLVTADQFGLGAGILF